MHGMVWYGILVTKHKGMVWHGVLVTNVWYGGVFQSFRVSAAVRPHHQAISARAREKGAIRSDLGQTKACARPPVKKGRTAAPVPKTRRPIRDSD